MTGLAIDSSSPAIVTGNPTATTGSFTPPNGSLLLIGFSGNASVAPSSPGAPTITDNLGSHLTYTRWEWASRPTSGVDGQVALWTAPVATGASMTVSVTNNDGAGNAQCAVSVWVLTNPNSTPVQVSGVGSSTSASAIAQSYTAAADNGWGFLVSCDWDALGSDTAGSGCTLDGSGTIPTNQISYAFEHRTVPDDNIGGLTTLNLNLPGTSTHLSWAYIEILPAVGDPPEKDPPPFIQFMPPGLISPRGKLNPWLGTANVAPDDTGLRISETSPDPVTQTDGTVSALVTKQFTPPPNSLLLVLWSGNTVDTIAPSQPTITDSLGTPLTYTRSDWQSRADAPTVNGQAAAWTAPVGASPVAMTVTVNNNAGSGSRQAALQVLVIINQNTSTPVGAHGKAGSASVTAIAQIYTASATGGQGFIAISDWSAPHTLTAGTDCYLAHVGDTGTIPTDQLSYMFAKRTIPDDVNGVSNRLNVNFNSAATAVAWVYIEILPTVGVGSQTITPSGIASGETDGSHTVTPGSVTISDNGVSSAEIIGSPTFSLFINDNEIESGEFVGSPAISPAVVENSIQSGEQVGSPTIAATYTINANGIPSTENSGNTQLGQSVTPSGIATTEKTGSPTVSSTYTITPQGVTSSEIVGNEQVSSTYTVNDNSVQSGEVLGSPTTTVVVAINDSSIQSGEQLGSPSITTTYTINANGVPSIETLGTPVVTPALTITTNGANSTEAVGSPAITTTVTISANGITSTETQGNSQVVPGAVTISASGIASNERAGTPTLTIGSAGIAGFGAVSQEQLGAATVTSTINVAVNGIVPQERVGAQSLANVVNPSSIQSTEKCGNSTLAPGSVTVQANGITSGQDFGLTNFNALNPIPPKPMATFNKDAKTIDEVKVHAYDNVTTKAKDDVKVKATVNISNKVIANVRP